MTNKNNVATWIEPEDAKNGVLTVRQYRMSRKQRNNWLRGYTANSKTIDPYTVRLKSKPEKEVSKKIINLILKIYIGVILAALLGFVCYFALKQVTLQEIVIDGTCSYSKDELIQAAGINIGDNLFLSRYKVKDATESLVKLNSFSATLKFPDTIIFHVYEKVPVMYTEQHGTRFFLSDDFTITEVTSVDADNTSGFLKVMLPDAIRAIAGEQMKYRETDDDTYIRDITNAIRKSPDASKCAEINLQNKFQIYVITNDNVKIYFGDYKQPDVKYKVGLKVLKENTTARVVDVSDISRITVE